MQQSWYHKVDDTDVYFVCLGKLSAIICVHCRAHSNDLALDPNFKMAYTEKNWDDEYYEQGMVKLHDVVSTSVDNADSHFQFDFYYVELAVRDTAADVENTPTQGLYGHSWMRASVKARKDQDSTKNSPQEELNAYLMAPLEEQVDDVIAWWGVSAVWLELICTDSPFANSSTPLNTPPLPALRETT